ncbi:hypothetical protein FOA52_008633 [Chlamydomonas sp. UWO 241]|nr:hypothetical protein FOA52_008633 [Chlamydomonas sp. UWO 241]
MAMSLTHAQGQAASAEAIEAVLLTGDLFGVVWQHLSALRNSPPPVLFAPDIGIDRSAAAALRLVSRGMRDLVDSMVAQLTVPHCTGTGISLESCVPRFAASLSDLTLQMQQIGDPSEIRDLLSVQLPHLEKLSIPVITMHDLAWHCMEIIPMPCASHSLIS